MGELITCIASAKKKLFRNLKPSYIIISSIITILKAIKSDNVGHLVHKLTSQGAVFWFLLDHSLKKLNSIWSSVQNHLPSNIFNFTIRYLNNTLSTRKYLNLWNLSQSSDGQFCLLSETLLHVVASCRVYLEQDRSVHMASQFRS